jgi:hypothetical protein
MSWPFITRIVGDAKRVGLEPEPQQAAVAIEGMPGVHDGKPREIGGGQRDLAEALGP